MVLVAQLVERRIVSANVAGSCPVLHPISPISSVGRARALQAWGRQFEPVIGHQYMEDELRRLATSS